MLHLVFTCKDRLRYSQVRALQSACNRRRPLSYSSGSSVSEQLSKQPSQACRQAKPHLQWSRWPTHASPSAAGRAAEQRPPLSIQRRRIKKNETILICTVKIDRIQPAVPLAAQLAIQQTVPLAGEMALQLAVFFARRGWDAIRKIWKSCTVDRW